MIGILGVFPVAATKAATKTTNRKTKEEEEGDRAKTTAQKAAAKEEGSDSDSNEIGEDAPTRQHQSRGELRVLVVEVC